MSTSNVKLRDMEVQKILMDIHQKVGHHGGLLESQGELLKDVHADGKETRRQTTMTNGRVNNLEENVIPDLHSQLGELRAELLQLKKTPLRRGIELTWDKIILFLGSIAIVIAGVIQALWK